MTLLSRDLFLRHRPRRSEDVPVPELATEDVPDPAVRVRALSATEVDRFVSSLWVEGPDGKLRYDRRDYAAKLVRLAAIDEQGAPLCKDGDTVAIGELEGEPVQRLAAVIERLSGLQVKSVESAAGN